MTHLFVLSKHKYKVLSSGLKLAERQFLNLSSRHNSHFMATIYSRKLYWLLIYPTGINNKHMTECMTHTCTNT